MRRFIVIVVVALGLAVVLSRGARPIARPEALPPSAAEPGFVAAVPEPAAGAAGAAGAADPFAEGAIVFVARQCYGVVVADADVPTWEDARNSPVWVKGLQAKGKAFLLTPGTPARVLEARPGRVRIQPLGVDGETQLAIPPVWIIRENAAPGK